MRRLIWSLAAGLALIGILAVLAFIQDPFGWRAGRLRKAASEVATAEQQAAARSHEARGEAQTTRRVEAAARRTAAAVEITTALSATAKAVPDANLPLDPDRAARLRAHDRELCRLAALNGCPAATDHAADGD